MQQQSSSNAVGGVKNVVRARKGLKQGIFIFLLGCVIVTLAIAGMLLNVFGLTIALFCVCVITVPLVLVLSYGYIVSALLVFYRRMYVGIAMQFIYVLITCGCVIVSKHMEWEIATTLYVPFTLSFLALSLPGIILIWTDIKHIQMTGAMP